MQDKKQIARQLYLTQGMTQKEIAAEVGVSERTIYTWVHQYAWNKLKLAAYQAPLIISNNLNSELVELQNHIASREAGMRFPTPQEAEVIRKLIGCMETMKKHPSLAHNMQMMESFREFARPLNKQFSQQLAHYADKYLTAQSRNGYAPYQVGHDMDTAALTHTYDELDGDQPCDPDNPPPYPVPCTDMMDCHRPGSCKWPHCKFERLTIDDPKGSHPADAPWAPLPAKLPEAPAPAAKPEITPEPIDNKSVNPLPVPPSPPEATGSFPAIPEEKNSNNNPSSLPFVPGPHR